jgi:DNA-binding NtrC family response regulator
MDQDFLKNILVVDDEEIFRNLLQKTLSLEGYAVDTARDGVEAIELLQSRKYSVILTDLMMPRASGIKVLQSAKAFDADIAVIIITGYASLDSALAAIKEGAYDYITKPFQLDEIKLTVANAHEKRRLLLENARLIEDLRKAYEKMKAIIEDKGEYTDKLRDITQELERRQKEIYDSVAAFRPGPSLKVGPEAAARPAVADTPDRVRRFQETTTVVGRKLTTSPRDMASLKKEFLDF